MSWGFKILLGALVLLSVATGVTKLIALPEEMALFRGAGFPDLLTYVFGGVQVVGGLLLVPARTRRVGAAIMTATFAVATAILFLAGNLMFGVVSILFIAAAAVFVSGRFGKAVLEG